jgi:hypothetical protein
MCQNVRIYFERIPLAYKMCSTFFEMCQNVPKCAHLFLEPTGFDSEGGFIEATNPNSRVILLDDAKPRSETLQWRRYFWARGYPRSGRQAC